MIPTSQIASALLMVFILTMPIGTHGFSIKLTPITSLFPKNLTLLEGHYKLVEISGQQQPQNYMIISTGTTTSALTSTNYSTAKPNVITPQLSVPRRAPLGFYITKVSIGSRLFSPYLIIDSGTDLSWVC